MVAIGSLLQMVVEAKGLKILVSPVRFLVAPLAKNANDLQNKLLVFFSFAFGLKFGYNLATL